MDLIEAAREWLDVPFEHQGRTRFGVDCLGLVKVAADKQDQIDIVIQDTTSYPRTPDGKVLKQECDRQLIKGDRSNLQYGDILLMRFKHHPQHLAIKTDKGIIHAFESAGKVVEHGLNDKWRKRIVEVYRLG